MHVDKDQTFPNSMSVPSRASFVVRATSKEDVTEAVVLAKKEGLPLWPLGDGTNILPGDPLKAVVLILDIKGMEEKDGALQIAAGEKWDDAVEFAANKNLSGIEALSAIPGKAGAAPIQNIGAYGAEVADTLVSVEAYDREEEKFVVLNKAECQFGYRDSLFKQNKGKFIVTAIQLQLSKDPPKVPKYKDVENYFSERHNPSPTLRQIREAIIEIRKNKLPDPKTTPNCGSFFKNPFVDKNVAEKLKLQFPEMPVFPASNKIKLSAGFLIEQAGFKGQKIGKIEVYKHNALVLTNPERADFSDLLLAKETIQKSVLAKFGIMLEPEVNIIQ